MEDDKTAQPHIYQQSKISFVSNDQNIKSHKYQGPGNTGKNSSRLNKNLTTPTDTIPLRQIQDTSPDIKTGTAKPPPSIMIATENGEVSNDMAGVNLEPERPLTPGGYLISQAKSDSPAKTQEDQGAKTPVEGTGKRSARKTFQAFQKFKNAFKIPKSNKGSSKQDKESCSQSKQSEIASKSGEHQKESELQTKTPKLEQTDSPEQLR